MVCVTPRSPPKPIPPPAEQPGVQMLNCLPEPVGHGAWWDGSPRVVQRLSSKPSAGPRTHAVLRVRHQLLRGELRVNLARYPGPIGVGEASDAGDDVRHLATQAAKPPPLSDQPPVTGLEPRA